MNYPVDTINFALGLGTVLIQVCAVVLLLSLFFRNRFSFFGKISAFAAGNALGIAFVLTLASLGLSLFYSEVLGFAPCGLCWLQREFMYPQAFLFLVALVKNDEKIADYSIVLSSVGVVIALYQHSLQMGASEFVPCAQTLLAADCAERTLFEFGYITFPLMAASVFAFLIVLMLSLRLQKKA
jgi:disulfide bond formation protein DsbB